MAARLTADRMRETGLRQAAAFCRQWDMLPRGGTVLCAVSGGRDSMALLHLLWTMAEQEGFTLAAAHYNHQLRPTADRDETLVRAWCREHGVPLTCGRGDVAEYARRSGRSLEDAARTLRYEFLEKTADEVGACRIATAHHRQDNAETVLLHLLRGAGPHGLTGIPPVRGRIVRPLLETDRAEIDRYVERNRVPFAEDETNADRAYTRNRLRLEVLPLLEEIAPGCTGRIAAAGSLLREEDSHLLREAEALLPVENGENEVTVPVPVLLAQDRAVRRRMVRVMGARLGAELTLKQTEAVLDLGSGGYLDLGDGLCAARKPHRLLLRRLASPPEPVELTFGEQVWGSWHVTLREAAGPLEENGRTVLLDPEKLTGPLTIAPWDGMGRLGVENGSRTIKRLFADRGIPVERRGEHPALYLNGRCAAVFGVATDRALQPADGGRSLCVVLRDREEPEENSPME